MFVSLQCLLSALTQGGEGGRLFTLTLPLCCGEGGRNTANKCHWRVWGVLAAYGPRWVSPSSRWHVLSGSTLLRCQVALQGYCPMRALCLMHFLGLSCSGSVYLLCKVTESVGHAFCGIPRSE